jgi:hypothetical protein
MGNILNIAPLFVVRGQLLSRRAYNSHLANIISFDGIIAGISIQGQIRLLPPSYKSISAEVTVAVNGEVALDNRPGEALKPVMFSSMHIASDAWDAQTAYIGAQTLIMRFQTVV